MYRILYENDGYQKSHIRAPRFQIPTGKHYERRLETPDIYIQLYNDTPQAFSSLLAARTQ